MVRHAKRIGITDITWGYDNAGEGYFLTVADVRVGWQETQTKEVLKVISGVCSSEEGIYLRLNTFPNSGYGQHVSVETMFTFMRRYGINPDLIGKSSPVNEGSPKICPREGCEALEIEGLDPHKRCARCKRVWYCSKTCQVADWKMHKTDCIEE